MQAIDLTYNYYALAAAILGPRKTVDSVINLFSPSRVPQDLIKMEHDDTITREMIALREQKFTFNEIAEQYGTTNNAVRNRVYRYKARCAP